MKARPRRAENRIAAELNAWFARHNLSPIERIPILGRKGPDFTYNELELNLDAKSRKSIPKSHCIPTTEIIYAYGLYEAGTNIQAGYMGIRLCDLGIIPTENIPFTRIIKPSKTVSKWIEHMGPNGGVVLHWPGKPFKNAVWCMKLETYTHILEVLDALKS